MVNISIVKVVSCGIWNYKICKSRCTRFEYLCSKFLTLGYIQGVYSSIEWRQCFDISLLPCSNTQQLRKGITRGILNFPTASEHLYQILYLCNGMKVLPNGTKFNILAANWPTRKSYNKLCINTLCGRFILYYVTCPIRLVCLSIKF